MSTEKTRELLDLLINDLRDAIDIDEINCEYHETRAILRLMEDLRVQTA